SPSLSLLPFALGSPSNPHVSSSAPLNHYFKPRPCPRNTAGIKDGSLIAAFRGRQLVNQEIEVPRGYRGLILGIGKRPDRGGLEVRSISSAATQNHPLTPASSVEGSGSGSGSRTRGAGQVALAKPIRGARRPEPRKRYRLDSDDEDEVVNPVRTPSKRTRSTTRLGVGTSTPDPKRETESLPQIKVVAATPTKDLPIAIRRLPSFPDALEEEVESSFCSAGEETLIPSPATENDPPAFIIPTRTSSLQNLHDSPPKEEDTDNNIRALKPLSTFTKINLWSPDAALAGFDAAEDIASGAWRIGAGGEGGDEIVRSLGEWLALSEMLNKPVYFDDLPDESDDDEEQ
ncbi:hypothetical protein P7C73_g5661, partial [Tremellales sp. Uapishka_1]